MKRPIEAWRSGRLFETGCGYLLISRSKSDGRGEAGFFLLDMFCLGVKEAGFQRFSDRSDLQENLLDPLFGQDDPVPMTPPAARKLAQDAVAYSMGLGFSPATDYKKACRVFGGISTADCDEEFVFGKEGKPFYIQGPSESPGRSAQILRVLEARCGAGGYHYILGSAGPDACDDQEAAEQVTLHGSGSGNSAALEAMAGRLRAEEPEIEVRVNPAGPRVSDMISLVAAPLLDSAPDYAAKRAILTLAATAWNHTLLPPAAQEEALANLAEQFPAPEVMEIFACLVARALTLFPDGRHIICKLETDPAPGGDLEVRVVSAM
jgi:hypothetical protein